MQGCHFLNEAKFFEVEATISYKVNMVNATNGDVTWSRFPLDVVAFYRVSRARIGGGLMYHMSTDLSGGGVAGNIDAEFWNALGFVLQGDYLFSGSSSGSGAFLGLRFTSLKYKEKSTGVSVDGNGNGVGIAGGYRFQAKLAGARGGGRFARPAPPRFLKFRDLTRKASRATGSAVRPAN